MMTPLRKDPKPIPFAVLQAELIEELSGLITEMAREEAILVGETARTIRQLRELHDYVVQVTKSVSGAACKAKARIIPFLAFLALILPTIAARLGL
jgi:hypothetical protein